MSDVMIRGSNLGKRYVIGHQAEGGANYDTLRDVLSEGARSLVRRFTGRSGGRRQTEEEFWALKDVSFEVKRGECVGIIGRNGAGKSTLLKILSRITEPTTGRIELNGRVASLLEVGTGFHPELTGRENIYLNGAILGMSRREIKAKFDEIVDFAEVEKFLDTPVKRYSSGMYVRLAFAVAAHLEPEILIVDEVLAVGDAAFQKKCLGKMGDVAMNEGRTVLFVSHNMSAIKGLCIRSIWLDAGQIQEDNLTNVVVEKYLDLGSRVGSQRVWFGDERPGNESFKINSVKLKNTLGEEVSTINISEDAYVEIEYEVVRVNTQVGFSIVVFDTEQNCVFSSLNNHEENYYGKPLKSGIYESICQIYGNLLNDKDFLVSLIAFAKNWTDPFRLDRVISMKVQDDGILKKDYYGNYGGFIRPKLKWKTKLKEIINMDKIAKNNQNMGV